MIIIDTLRADKLGCYGFSENISPQIDRIAENGVIFKKVISQSSWTRPSIGSMLTSLYPRSLGIYKEKYDILHDKYLTLAEILRDNGYSTLGITANPNINSVFNFDQGFETYVDSKVVWGWMKSEKGKKKDLKGINPLQDSKKIFKSALKMVKSVSNPSYLQINIMDVHEGARLAKGGFKKRNYLRAISKVSANIDKFIKKTLSVSGWEDTLFIITSDHGHSFAGEHQGVKRMTHTGHGDLIYECQVSVPLLLYHFGKLKTAKIKKPVRLLDLMPTVLDYLDIPLPENIQGKSLLHLINKDGSVDLPPNFITETNWRKINKVALYSNEWKYIENRDGQTGTNKNELQPMSVSENGIETDKINENVEIGKRMKESLDLWEKSYPKLPRTSTRQQISPAEVEQLKSLGYLN